MASPSDRSRLQAKGFRKVGLAHFDGEAANAFPAPPAIAVNRVGRRTSEQLAP